MTDKKAKEDEWRFITEFPRFLIAYAQLGAWRLCVAALALGLVLGSGCSTPRSEPKAVRATEGINEYERLINQASAAVTQTVRSMDALSAQTNHHPQQSVKTF